MKPIRSKGRIISSSWQGFRANDEPLKGKLRISVNLESADQSPTAAQRAAYRFLKENECSVTENVLRGLFADYPQMREAYGSIEPDYLPTVERAEDFCRLIKPINVHINTESKDEHAYIGFEFDCLWDIEHGLGVMTHKGEYVGCNDAEAAWNLDLARS